MGFATFWSMAEPARKMQVSQVDERDNGWEDSAPRFRVYLHGSGETSTYGSTDTYDITGGGLAWLVGMDGNDTTREGSAERAVQHKMLRRRHNPVGIPETDRAPKTVPNPYSDGTREQ